MMLKSAQIVQVNLDTAFEKSIDGDDVLIIEGYASTPAVDADGDTISVDAWDLKRYKKNPIILFNHNKSLPIGSTIEIKPDAAGLFICAVISKSSEYYALVKEGVLKTFSVGFYPKELKPKNEKKGGFTITKAELLEISVVSVPSNPEAVFSVKKSFDSDEAFESYYKQLNGSESETPNTPKEKNLMDEEQIKALEALTARLAAAEKAAAEAAAKVAEREAAEKAAAEKAAAEKAAAAFETRVMESSAEKIEAAVKSATEAQAKAFETNLNEAIKTNREELEKMFASRRPMNDRTETGDWKKELKNDVENAYLLGMLTKKGVDGTDYGKSVLEKVNTFSSGAVSSGDFEQVVSTNIEKDIEQELILKPLFREIAMTSATMIVPIQPDAGYAEITAAQRAADPSGKGNLDSKGATYGTGAGITMVEKIFSTKKLISKAWIANETEEDSIMAILPIIRDSMVRSHARAVENGFLLGNTAEGYYTTGGMNSLGSFAAIGGKSTQAAGIYAVGDKYTAATLMTARRSMGKYGVDPRDVVYIVSTDMYYDLIEDPEWKDLQLVGDAATKLRGEVGNIYGSKVLVSPEFNAKAAGKTFAFAVNTRNFVVPRLRGITAESQYLVQDQAEVLVTSQRLNFDEIIAGAKSVWSLKHKAA